MKCLEIINFIRFLQKKGKRKLTNGKSAFVKFRMGDYECPLGVFVRDDKSNCNEVE